ncbi:MAG: cache domain-containing protein [Chloroflexi bacterium]|nr:cache domain-containing protein [Chloroflexota bacterium]
MIFTNYSLEKVKLLLTTLELGRTGYAFLLSGNGLYISHPDEAYVAGSKTIFDVAEARNDAVLNSIGDLAAQGESGLIDYNNTVTGQPSWVFLEPIPSTNWTLGVVFIKDEISLSNEAARHRLVWIAVGSMSFLLFLTALVVRVHRGSPPRLWATALVFTVLSLGTILYIWSLAVGTDLDRNEEDVMVFDTAGVRKFLAPYEDRVRQQHRTDVVHIPTGIFIQSVEFSTANNVLVSGYIWQRYPAGTPEWVSQGFVLPEAIETPDIIESYRSDNGEVVGWNFRATLRQQFDYSKYPFDREDVWIRLWHQNFEREVVLVPDLISYKEVNPTSKPGLEQQDFVLEGWSTTSSFFSYRLNSYNTNFGMEQFLVHDDVPELYFNIGLARNFTNPFVSNLLPVVVVVFLLFAVLMIASREDDKSQLFGFSTSNVLTFCAALFFVVILGHIDLRSKLTASEIIYLEYFFFVMYIAILAVSVNSILFVSHAGVSLIQYKDNFIPKLLYWPVIAALLLGVTLWVFY